MGFPRRITGRAAHGGEMLPLRLCERQIEFILCGFYLQSVVALNLVVASLHP